MNANEIIIGGRVQHDNGHTYVVEGTRKVGGRTVVVGRRIMDDGTRTGRRILSADKLTALEATEVFGADQTDYCSLSHAEYVDLVASDDVPPTEPTPTDPAPVVKCYDVLQIDYRDGNGWNDYITLKEDSEIALAIRIVNGAPCQALPHWIARSAVSFRIVQDGSYGPVIVSEPPPSADRAESYEQLSEPDTGYFAPIGSKIPAHNWPKADDVPPADPTSTDPAPVNPTEPTAPDDYPSPLTRAALVSLRSAVVDAIQTAEPGSGRWRVLCRSLDELSCDLNSFGLAGPGRSADGTPKRIKRRRRADRQSHTLPRSLFRARPHARRNGLAKLAALGFGPASVN